MKSKKNFQNNSPCFAERIEALQTKLKKNKIDFCLIDNPIDLFYYTGLRLSLGRLIVHQKNICLFVDGRYIEIAQAQSVVPSMLNQESAQLGFIKANAGKAIIFDSLYTSYDQFLKLENFTKKLGASFQLKADSSFFKALRLIKDSTEIAAMKRSADVLFQGFKHIRKVLKKGITEKQLAQSFEMFCLSKGAQKLAFDPIIAFGANSAMPHYRAGDARLKKGDIVLIDIGVVVDSYHSDMTRVVFFEKIDPYFMDVYTVVRNAHAAALKKCRPGNLFGKLDEAAREEMRKEKMESHFLHSLGHGIGMETHEYPRIKYDGEEKALMLEPGMVFTIEPGLYLPGKGGIRYEDTVVITPKGYENFFPDMKQKDLLIKGS